jgi:hypothetical protein
MTKIIRCNACRSWFRLAVSQFIADTFPKFVRFSLLRFSLILIKYIMYNCIICIHCIILLKCTKDIKGRLMNIEYLWLELELRDPKVVKCFKAAKPKVACVAGPHWVNKTYKRLLNWPIKTQQKFGKTPGEKKSFPLTTCSESKKKTSTEHFPYFIL